jgi:hypothetical protein
LSRNPAGCALAKTFRRLFLDGLEAAFRRGELGFFGNLVPLAEVAAFAERACALRDSPFVVYAKPPFGGACVASMTATDFERLATLAQEASSRHFRPPPFGIQPDFGRHRRAVGGGDGYVEFEAARVNASSASELTDSVTVFVPSSMVPSTTAPSSIVAPTAWAPVDLRFAAFRGGAFARQCVAEMEPMAPVACERRGRLRRSRREAAPNGKELDVQATGWSAS